MIKRLDKDSQKALKEVHPDLVKIVGQAFESCAIDFLVSEGARNQKEQTLLAKYGLSSKRSKHLIQSDNYAHAVDLIPLIHGKIRPEQFAMIAVAKSIRAAVIEFQTDVIWGGNWQSLGNSSSNLEQMITDYTKECFRRVTIPTIEPYHFELAD